MTYGLEMLGLTKREMPAGIRIYFISSTTKGSTFQDCKAIISSA